MYANTDYLRCIVYIHDTWLESSKLLELEFVPTRAPMYGSKGTVSTLPVGVVHQIRAPS